MTAHFIKCAAREKRSPTCLNYGQFVEDKTTENKKVIPLFVQTQQTILNNGNKKSYLSLTFLFKAPSVHCSFVIYYHPSS